MAKVSFPSRCAVAVVCGEHLVTQVYPAAVPIEVFMDNIVELINGDLKRRGVNAIDTGIGYELQRANGTRLDPAKTLDELGVEDGSTLVLVPVEHGEAFEPQYESLSTGLARIGKRLFTPVTAQTAVQTSLALVGVISATILGLAVYTRAHTESLSPSIVAMATGLLLVAGAFSVWRWWPERIDLLTGLIWPAVPLVAVGFAAAAPETLGSPHLFIAALVMATMTCVVTVIARRYTALAATFVILSALSALVAAARMWQPIPVHWLGMCALFTLLVLLTAGPTLALWTVRIRPPHFGSITGRDVFQRSDGMPADAVAPVDEGGVYGSDPDITPKGPSIAELAKRVNGVLTGICIACAISLPLAVWATLVPGRARSNAAALLAALFVLIFVIRARTFTDRRQAVALVCGASTAFAMGITRYVAGAHNNSATALLWGTTILICFAGIVLAVALLVPATRFTPLVRMATEWLELTAIVIALPLAAWIGGLFTWVRMR